MALFLFAHRGTYVIFPALFLLKRALRRTPAFRIHGIFRIPVFIGVVNAAYRATVGAWLFCREYCGGY